MNDAKIEEILSQMTFEEKAAMLSGAGSMQTAGVPRLGVEPKRFADGPHGIRTDKEKNCTMFPNLCCVGSSWDRELVEEMGRGLAADCIEHGVDMLLGPGINIKRYMLCGRNFEYLSEDPVVSGELGAAYINGLQKCGVGASLKHFAVNNQEQYRFEMSAELDERTLREIYLKGFEIAVKKSQPMSVMCAYNKVNAIYCSENKLLQQDILRDEWGFEGFVVSDWNAVHDKPKSIKYGLDLQMPKGEDGVGKVKEGLENGTITMDDVDTAVRRMIKFHLMPKPQKREYDRGTQHDLAKRIASAGTVLLENKNEVLPAVDGKYKKIAVIGEFAERPLITGQGSAAVYPDERYIDSPLEELRKSLPETEIVYKQFYSKSELPDLERRSPWIKLYDFNEFTSDCDLVILFMGAMNSHDTEFFDRPTAGLSFIYEMYIEEAYKRGKKTVLVLQNGGAMLLDKWKDKVDAIVEMWLGGEAAGSAAAEVLCGEVNPSGKLAETFPKLMRSDIDYPGDGLKVIYKEGLDVGYRYYDKHTDEILYPFGYGLSYTSFEYSNCSINMLENGIEVEFDLENTGEYDGSEVIQIYVSDPVSVIDKPVKELKDFEKIFLKKGEKRRIKRILDVNALAYYNIMLKDWIIEDGEYDILIGSSSLDIRLSGSVEYNKNHYTLYADTRAIVG